MLFDNLYLNSFGWGGDPNNALRLRADKNKLYNFQGSFRRDQNFSDFDLLANPLNPSTSTPSIPVLNSPHLFDTTRRMSDVDLTLLPQSRVSFRLGFSHNNMTGPSFSSIHEGTEALLLQAWNTTMNSYRMGVDLESRRELFSATTNSSITTRETRATRLAPFAPAFLEAVPGVAPIVGQVSLGLSIDTKNNVPCAVKAPATSLINSSGVLTNNNCSAYSLPRHRTRPLRLFAVPADSYLLTHRAGQFAQQLLPAGRLCRFLFL